MYISSANNFDFLRLIFAITVFFVHSVELTHNDKLEIIKYVFNSGIAVKSFFIISGFLIFMSYEKSISLKSYIIKRIQRIYPAYFCVVLLCGFLGSLLSNLSFNEYFKSIITWKYIFYNLIFLNFLQPFLPGVFENNLLNIVNGALWTLKIEVLFYIFVPVFTWVFLKQNKRNKNFLIVLIYILSEVYFNYFNHLSTSSGHSFYAELSRQLPGQMAFFMSGILIYYNFAIFMEYSKQLLLMAIVIYFSLSFTHLYFLEPIILACMVMYFAFHFPAFNKVGKYGDFSYGCYILHFPILQTLIQIGLFQYNPYLAFAISSFLLILGAFFSWHIIEKPFLRRKQQVKLVSDLRLPNQDPIIN